jgi:hypothetical protein
MIIGYKPVRYKAGRSIHEVNNEPLFLGERLYAGMSFS